jgi:hypothetical protein
MKTNKSIIDLFIELEKVNKQLETIRDPKSGYIDAKVKEIYGDKQYITAADRTKLNSLIDQLITEV